MNYHSTLEFLFSQLPAFHRIGKPAYKDNLTNSIVLDEHFNYPHKHYTTIHVAGTNGKGSVSHMLASVLQEAGYRTGLYTSPHLKDFRERIKVNGNMIPENEVIAFVSNNNDTINSINPSFFEITVAMAFDYFAKAGVEVAVIEAGMGGRLDSTNIISPCISVITNIGHDHMEFLGDTMEKIAYEKAGIIKENVPVIIGESIPETKRIFFERSYETGSDIFFAEECYLCKLGDYLPGQQDRSFSVNNLITGKTFSGKIPLPGDYQARNLQTLLQTADLLGRQFNISDENLINGIKRTILNTGLMGRWQTIGKNPLTICDTGHNKEGIEYIIRQISKIPNTGVHMIIGFVNDKDLGSILPLLPEEATYYFTKAAVPRALDENILAMRASEYKLSGKCYSSVEKAYRAARQAAQKSDLIFIGGSTFVVADVV